MFGKGWFGFEERRERLFEKGDLKYVIVDLLAERPRHGYDVIQALEERFKGVYAPSPGSVYPILQMLDDMGLVVVEAKGGRKTYTITKEGRAFLAENRATVDEIWARVEHHHGFGSRGEAHAMMHELRHELRDLVQLLFRGRKRLTPDKIARLREALARTRKELEGIVDDR